MKNSHLIPHVPQQSNSICSREWHEEREGQVSCDWKPDVNNGVWVNADGDGWQPDQDASSKLWHFQNPILHQDWGKATRYRIDWKEVFTTYPNPWFWFYCGLLSICSFSLTEYQQWSSSNWPRLQWRTWLDQENFNYPLLLIIIQEWISDPNLSNYEETTAWKFLGRFTTANGNQSFVLSDKMSL